MENSTPIYIIEEAKLRRNLALIKDVAERTGSEFILAFKAFALWKTFPIFREYIQSTTASSLSEAMLAYHEFGKKAHTFSPAYTDGEFDDIVACSSHITFNSLSQYERFHHRASSCSIGLRVNPEYSEVGTTIIPALQVHALALRQISCRKNCRRILTDSIAIAIVRVGQMCLNGHYGI